MNDIARAGLFLAMVAILLSITYQCARADEWFPSAAIFVDVTLDDGLYCHDADNEASHLGARVDLWGSGRHRVRTLWVHNSCVQEEDDLRDRDVLGIGYEYRLW